MGPLPLARGARLFLVTAAERIAPAWLSERLAAIPPRTRVAELPAYLMGERPDAWAAYLWVQP